MSVEHTAFIFQPGTEHPSREGMRKMFIASSRSGATVLPGFPNLKARSQAIVILWRTP
jgi:hypothetical protein